jgi:hypothetical protein
VKDDDVAHPGVADLEHGEARADLERRRHALRRRAVGPADELEADRQHDDQAADAGQEEDEAPAH